MDTVHNSDIFKQSFVLFTSALTMIPKKMCVGKCNVAVILINME